MFFMIIPTLERPKFSLGEIVATPEALKELPRDVLLNALDRHMVGKNSPDTERDEPKEIVSTFTNTDGMRFFIRTNADRSSTVISLEGENCY